MRLPILTALAGAVMLAACQPSAEFDPDDPAIVAVIDSIVEETMEASRNVDADRVLAMAEGEGELTFITGDVMLSGLEVISGRPSRDTYAGLEGQDQTVFEKRVRVLSPDVAIVIATWPRARTLTDAGWTSGAGGNRTPRLYSSARTASGEPATPISPSRRDVPSRTIEG